MHDEERGGCFGDTGPGEQGCYVECAGVGGGEGGCCLLQKCLLTMRWSRWPARLSQGEGWVGVGVEGIEREEDESRCCGRGE